MKDSDIPAPQAPRQPAADAVRSRSATQRETAPGLAHGGGWQDRADRSPRVVAQARAVASMASRVPPGAVVQRKVGFEIEVVPDRIALAPAEDGKQRAPLTKGETVHAGNGWKLTPDAFVDGTWTPEYIVQAIDETTSAAQIPLVLAEVARHATRDLHRPKRWSAGDGLAHRSDMRSQPTVGNFHVTGGLRLSRLGQLVELLDPGKSALVARANGTHWFDENYKNVVALIAAQIADLKAYAQAQSSAGKPLVSSDEDEDFVTFGGGRLKGMPGLSEDLPSGPKDRDRRRLSVDSDEDEEEAPPSAKLGVSVLSRTNLGAVLGQVKGLTRQATFEADVLTAAGVKPGDPLFGRALPGSQGSGRTIDDQSTITVRDWLIKLWSETDYVWSETKDDGNGSFPMEPVGPSTLGHRASGVVLELRNLEEQGNYSPLAKDWADVGVKYATVFSMLNAKKSNPEIGQALGGVQDDS